MTHDTIELIQTILLVVLVDRNFILRDRYKLSIYGQNLFFGDRKFPSWLVIAILHKSPQGDGFRLDGGKTLFRIKFKPKK